MLMRIWGSLFSLLVCFSNCSKAIDAGDVAKEEVEGYFITEKAPGILCSMKLERSDGKLSFSMGTGGTSVRSADYQTPTIKVHPTILSTGRQLHLFIMLKGPKKPESVADYKTARVDYAMADGRMNYEVISYKEVLAAAIKIDSFFPLPPSLTAMRGFPEYLRALYDGKKLTGVLYVLTVSEVWDRATRDAFTAIGKPPAADV